MSGGAESSRPHQMGDPTGVTAGNFLRAVPIAATVQLTVPVIAALGGIAFLGEPITLRLTVASLVILGGISLVILEK